MWKFAMPRHGFVPGICVIAAALLGLQCFAQIPIEAGTIQVTATYLGQPASAASPRCSLTVAIDDGSVGFYVCSGGSASVTPGEHTVTLLHEVTSVSPVLPVETVQVVAGTTTTLNFEVGGVLGVLTGQVLVNGEPPPPNTHTIEIRYGGAFGEPLGEGGNFTYLLPAGSGTGTIRSPEGAILGSFSFTVLAGTTVDLGNPLNARPEAQAGADETVIMGESATFNGTDSFDPDGTIVSFEWTFGDGGSANGAIVSHVYTTAGQFTATLTVTDDDGATDDDSATVTVQTVSQAIQSLSDLVASFNFQQGIANSLDGKLQRTREALDAANAGQRQDAANKLQAFINEVNAQRGDEITDAQADTLITLAQRILATL